MSVASNGGTESSVSRADALEERQRSRFEARTIGIYGPRSAGKTCYLATAFQGASSSANCTVLLRDEGSRCLLLEHWDKLKTGEKPDATALSFAPLFGSVVISMPEDSAPAEVGTSDRQGPDPASVEMVERKRRVPFQTRDFGGRLAERGDTGAPQLTAEFHRWLEESDCLLFFLAVDQLEKADEAQKRLLEVDTLLARLVEKSPGGHAISQPIAVLVTKWDLVSDLSGTPEEEQKKLIEFLRERAAQVGYNICEKIERAGEQVAVFPVSTFGGHVDGKPICPLKPFNLHGPLVWALERTDRCLYEKARAQAEAALDSRLWKNYTAAIKAYNKLIEGYGINHGPFYEKAQAELSSLYAARTRRTRSLLAVCCAVLLGAVLWGSYSSDRSRYVELAATLEAPCDPYPELENRVMQYQKSHNPWGWLRGHKADIAARWEQYQQEIDRNFRELEEFRKSAAPAELEQRIEHYRRFVVACQDFLGKYPESPHQGQVITWSKEAQQERNQLEFVHSVETLISQWAAEAKTPQKAEALLAQAKQLAERKQNVLHTQAVEQTSAKLNDLMRDLNAFLGDAQAQCEKFVTDVDRFLKRLKEATAEQPGDLDKLRRMREQAADLLNRQLLDHPDMKERVKEARNSLAEQLTTLEGTIDKREREVQQWLAEADKAQSSAETALNDGNQDLSPVKKASEQAIASLDKARGLTKASGIEEMAQRLKELKEQLYSEVKRYEQFDEKYAKLNDDLRALAPEKQRAELEEFLLAHPEGNYPRRRTELGQLVKKMRDLGGDIEKSRWEAVEKKFNEFSQLCEKLGDGTRLDAVQRAYDELLAQIQDYRRQDNPAPARPDDANKLENKARGLLDQAEWKDVELFANKNFRDYKGIAQKAKAYLDHNDRIKADERKFRQEAENCIRKALADRWKEVYQEFHDRAVNMQSLTNLGAAAGAVLGTAAAHGAMPSLTNLQEAEEKCNSLLDEVERDRNGPFKGFLPRELDSKLEKVQEWRRWAKALSDQKARNLTMTVDTTKVADYKIRVAAKVGDNPVPLEMDGKRYNNNWFAGKKDIEVILPAHNFRKNSLTPDLFIELDDWGPNPTASVSVQLPEALFRQMGRTKEFEFPGWKGKKGTLRFHCPELTPPELDPP